eukprot:CAMPEP_0172860906 /NCGR_PEP_ID=MMETSP1075-20121228/72358_1 /TAXON_ID=2916 /ORGANISM="Ceratium fusus, Strain PA161109" /LENGTH=483 /DNA_ID=CAMNT_0013708989 /DNA_START=177 /DNA_END=1625 /DNA_ORIENTATION=-
MIKASFPHVLFNIEMKHPDEWRAYVKGVCKRFEFTGFDDSFNGPLIWTPEGKLIGRGADFVQNVYLEKFRLQSPPMVTEERFRKIAKDNMAQVLEQRRTARGGPSLAEQLEATKAKAQDAGALQSIVQPAERRTVICAGVPLELHLSELLETQWESCRAARAAAEEEGIDWCEAVPPDCCISTSLGKESHHCLLHPRPLADLHTVLVPNESMKPGDEGVQIMPRTWSDGGLNREDFFAASEVLLSGQSRACVSMWLGIRDTQGDKVSAGLGDHLRPLDTHLQVLPSGFEPEAEPPFPTALHFARIVSRLAENSIELPCSGLLEGTCHALKLVVPMPEILPAVLEVPASELAENLEKAYMQASSHLSRQLGLCAGVMVAFTPFWLLIVPLTGPQHSRFSQAAWQKLPPPPPCALLGRIVCPTVLPSWPETAGLGTDAGDVGPLVSNRAVAEGIAEDSEEWQIAEVDIRIRVAKLFAAPMEAVKY